MFVHLDTVLICRPTDSIDRIVERPQSGHGEATKDQDTEYAGRQCLLSFRESQALLDKVHPKASSHVLRPVFRGLGQTLPRLGRHRSEGAGRVEPQSQYRDRAAVRISKFYTPSQPNQARVPGGQGEETVSAHRQGESVCQ